MLRLQVERQLADGGEGLLAVFFLPVASGGLLEYVRDVVAETIAQKEALGLPVYSARALLWDGDAARAVRDFQRSSRRYGQAYRMATRVITGELAPEQH